MARSFQQMIILGNLGRDPEVRYTPSGTAVAKLLVATSKSRKDKNTDQWIEETEWHRCVLFGKQAERAGEKLKKGRMVHLVGEKKTNKWQDQNGQDQYTVEIIVNTMLIFPANENSQAGAADGPVYQSQGSTPASNWDADDIPQ